ncbi:MAG: TlpA disulfide reductase family protein [Verrucomicrobiota bacterium]
MFRRWFAGLASLAVGFGLTGPALGGDPALPDSPVVSTPVGSPPPPLQVGEWIQGPKLREFQKGRVYVVDFWATWCGPCQAAIPHLTELAHRYPGNLEVVGISISEKREGPDDLGYVNTVRRFVRKMGARMDYPVAVDTVDQAMHRTWFKPAGTAGIPTAYVIDREGRVAWVGIGEAAVVDRIAGEVLAGTFDPAKEVERQREAEREAERRSAADIAAARAGGEEQDRAFPGYRAAMARGDSAAALASLNAAFHERPASEAEGAYQWKLMLLLKRNRPADVNDYARHLLDAFPKNDDVVSFVAACLVATGEEARFDVRVAYEAAKTSDAAAKPGTRWAQFARWRLAWANYHVGNRAEAIRLADETLTAIGALKSTLDLDSLETECREALEIFKTQPQRAP